MTDQTTDRHVAEARRAVHESLTLLPAWEADRVRSLIADLESAVESRTAVRMADAASAAPLPPADQPALDSLSDTLYDALYAITPFAEKYFADEREGLRSAVRAVLDAAVLPAPVDRALVFRAAADALGGMDYDTGSSDYGYDTYRDAWNGGVMDGAALLRRVADETAATSDVGTEFVQQVDQPDEAGLGAWERDLADETAATETQAGCAHCGGGHAWEDCEAYTRLVADEKPAAGARQDGAQR
ncbi:hypothetical protein [Streptomyces rochei]|uniref:hypothetical protein n=1 Tax=Streptomyces rochei TaxID=1928 RepID=UPI0036AD5E85